MVCDTIVLYFCKRLTVVKQSATMQKFKQDFALRH